MTREIAHVEAQEVASLRLPDGWRLAHEFFMDPNTIDVMMTVPGATELSLDVHRHADGVVKVRRTAPRPLDYKLDFVVHHSTLAGLEGDVGIVEIYRPTLVDLNVADQVVATFRYVLKIMPFIDYKDREFVQLPLTLRVWAPDR